VLLRPLRASDSDRERARAILREASVHGRLTVEELAERVERVERAGDQRELARITGDLPPAPPALVGTPAEHERQRAVLSSLKRSGHWRPARKGRYLAVLGTVDLDLRNATLPGPEVDIELVSWFGTSRVRVPPGVEVQVHGGGLLCSCDVDLGPEPPAPGAPVVRVRTRGLLGSSRVRTQTPILDRLVSGARRLAERHAR